MTRSFTSTSDWQSPVAQDLIFASTFSCICFLSSSLRRLDAHKNWKWVKVFVSIYDPPPSTIQMRTYCETFFLHADEHVFICGRSNITVLHASTIRCSVTGKTWKHNIIILTDMCSVQNKVPDLKCPNFGCRRHNFLGIFFQKKIYVWPACLSTFRFYVISNKLQVRKHVNWIVAQPMMEPINDA